MPQTELWLEVTREHLRAAGITLDDRGGVKLEQVLQKGQELAKTEDQVYPMFFREEGGLKSLKSTKNACCGDGNPSVFLVFHRKFQSLIAIQCPKVASCIKAFTKLQGDFLMEDSG